jgi:hypothetical protein
LISFVWNHASHNCWIVSHLEGFHPWSFFLALSMFTAWVQWLVFDFNCFLSCHIINGRMSLLQIQGTFLFYKECRDLKLIQRSESIAKQTTLSRIMGWNSASNALNSA